jgi:hypothetical protein
MSSMPSERVESRIGPDVGRVLRSPALACEIAAMSPFRHRKEDASSHITAAAGIERVFTTGHKRSMTNVVGTFTDPESLMGYELSIVFAFAGVDGEQLVVERELLDAHMRWPGAQVEVSYDPSDPEGTLDFVRSPYTYPDPAEPRGWSSGVFDFPRLGARCAFGPDPQLDAERELFRTGARATAEILARKLHLLHGRDYIVPNTLTLRVDGRELQTDAHLPQGTEPKVGDLIEVAVSPDGARVALDTDERWRGPLGQLLVYARPAIQLEATAPSAISALAEGNPVVASLFQQVAAMKQSRHQMGKRYEKMVRAQLDGQRRAGQIDDAAYELLLQEALSE